MKSCSDTERNAKRYLWLKSQEGLVLRHETAEWIREDGSKYVTTHSLSANSTQHVPHESLDDTIDAAMLLRY